MRSAPRWKFPQSSTSARFMILRKSQMVARDGVEPPTPAFSDLVQPEPTATYRFAGDCQVPANTDKAERSWAGIMGRSFSDLKNSFTISLHPGQAFSGKQSHKHTIDQRLRYNLGRWNLKLKGELESKV